MFTTASSPCSSRLLGRASRAGSVGDVSFAIGVALGRFGANQEGLLTEAPVDALPAGILYLTCDEALPDSLEHPAAKRILDAWKEHAPAILQGKRPSLNDWLKKEFFKYHLGLYENRPIYFPLASSQKGFVASSASTAGPTTPCKTCSRSTWPRRSVDSRAKLRI